MRRSQGPIARLGDLRWFLQRTPAPAGAVPAREVVAALQEEETSYILPQRWMPMFCCACVVEMVMLLLLM